MDFLKLFVGTYQIRLMDSLTVTKFLQANTNIFLRFPPRFLGKVCALPRSFVYKRFVSTSIDIFGLKEVVVPADADMIDQS